MCNFGHSFTGKFHVGAGAKTVKREILVDDEDDRPARLKGQTLDK